MGEKNGYWKGGRTVTGHGYVLVRVGVEHHLADVRGYAYEHRIVAEQKIGRRLFPNELVHHINGDKQDNRPENLEIVSDQFHHRIRHRKSKSRRRLPGESNPQISCRCGCGQQFQKYDEGGRPREYVSGHNPPNSPTMDLILSALSSGPKKTSELKALLDSSHAVATCLSKLKKHKLIRNPSHGLWEVATDGNN